MSARTHAPRARGERGERGGGEGGGTCGICGERGQAAVELVATFPLLLVIALAVTQLFAVGSASVLAGNAAEAGALALAGGGDAPAAARAALPGWTRAHGRVSVEGGEVTVRLRPPALLRALSRRLEVSAAAGVEGP
ncbi:MAG TPA: hypothetical protein VF072_09160 [Thermoleophilaceae bacterium]